MPQDQHYIPAFYLRRWVDKEDSKLCVYSRPYDRVKAYRKHPEAKVIRIPNNWGPRAYQMNVWRYLEQGGKRGLRRLARPLPPDGAFMRAVLKASL